MVQYRRNILDFHKFMLRKAYALLDMEFGTEAKMLKAHEILESTRNPVGGVCPFGLKNRLDIFRKSNEWCMD